jgi:hypothetical protein
MGTSMERTTALNRYLRAILAIGGTMLLMACSADQEAKPMTPQSLKSELDRDLKTGASFETVAAYLTEKGFEHSGLIDNANQAHLGGNPETFEIKSIVRKTKKSVLVTTDIAITVIFDRSKKLTAIAVKEVHTGL